MRKRCKVILKGLFSVAVILCTLFNASASADLTIRTNDYFLKNSMSILDGPSQFNEGSFFKVNEDLFVIRRFGQIFMYSVSGSEWRFVSQFPIKEMLQEDPNRYGFSGVKGALFHKETQKLFVSTVNIYDDCTKLEIYSSRYFKSTNRFEKFQNFLTLPLCVPSPVRGKNEDMSYPNFSQSGGQLLRYSRNSLLFTVGNFGDSWQLSEIEKNNLGGRELLGSSILIDLKFATFQVFTSGHRNAQGLVLDQNSKTFFSVEHGQEGGDELNALAQGKNYGWPLVTLGHPYSDKDGFFLNHKIYYKKSLSDGKSLAPVFAWSPSVAPSRVIQVEEIFHWRNNLLVATLKDLSIRRLVMSDNKVILDERVYLGFRLRDIIEFRNELFILDDRGYVHRLKTVDRNVG